MQCLTVFVILGGGWVVEYRNKGVWQCSHRVRICTLQPSFPSIFILLHASCIYTLVMQISVDNLSVTVKALALRSIYAEYWGLKCSFTNPSD